MTTEQASISFVSVVEDVLQQHGILRKDIDPATRKLDEASARRYEAAEWLRKMVGVVGGSKDFPSEPSEEEFKLGLRSGIILCNVFNKVQPGRIAKVVEGPGDSYITTDVAPLSAFQYFENLRNFLVAAEEMGLPSFENSDLEQGGKTVRVVNCVLALKSYHEWKQSGGTGPWKYGGNSKPGASPFGKFTRKMSEPFGNSSSRSLQLGVDSGNDHTEAVSAGHRSLNTLVQAALSHRNQEEIPNVRGFCSRSMLVLSFNLKFLVTKYTHFCWDDEQIVESMLSKVMEEYEHRLASQSEAEDQIPSQSGIQEESNNLQVNHQEASYLEWNDRSQESRRHLIKQQQMYIQELRRNLQVTKAGMQFLQTKHLEEFNSLGKHLYGLAHTASGYQRVLQENRKLYNQVQDLKGNIRVYCRVRPFLPGEVSRFSSVDHIEEGNITIATPSKYGKEGRKTFTFNKVFGPMATQAEVFVDTQPLIRSVLDGYNVCIFAYGQTGSGKTYTMTGPNELTEEGLGVNYRALSDLFHLSAQRKEVISYRISCQMLEIYNEQVRDLLTSDGINKRYPFHLEIHNSSNNGLNVPDAVLMPVSSTSDVINLMNTGHSNRAVSATSMNERSSRSHSCLTVHVQGKDLTSGNVIHGSMHLVDLAGSERVDKSEVTGDRLKEAQHINKSLSALGDVIASLAAKSTHVPYRNSKLTQLLQDSLGGQAKTLMFIHISPEFEALGETLSTLKFAERVATIELGAAKVNKDSTEVKDLKDQVFILTTSSILKAALASQPQQHSVSSTPERFGSRPGATSPSQRSWHGGSSISNGFGQPADEVSNSQVLKDSSYMLRKRSLDAHNLLSNLPTLSGSRERPVNNGKGDEKDSYSGEWVDKTVVHKHKDVTVEKREVDSRTLPDDQHSLAKNAANRKDSSYQDLDFDVRSQKSQSEVMSNDGSEDLDSRTSDCSESDSIMWQPSNIPRMSSSGSSIPTLSGAKVKKSSPRKLKTTEIRSMIPSLIPSPSSTGKKVANGGLKKPVKQQLLSDGKRKSGLAK
ncbi:Kinesin-like protein KIN-14G [Linum perenne]